MRLHTNLKQTGVKALAVLSIVAVAGCVTYPQREDFGDAVKHMQDVQSATADTAGSPQDGERGRAMLKVYREDVASPQEIKSDITITIGAGEK